MEVTGSGEGDYSETQSEDTLTVESWLVAWPLERLVDGGEIPDDGSDALPPPALYFRSALLGCLLHHDHCSSRLPTQTFPFQIQRVHSPSTDCTHSCSLLTTAQTLHRLLDKAYHCPPHHQDGTARVEVFDKQSCPAGLVRGLRSSTSRLTRQHPRVLKILRRV